MGRLLGIPERIGDLGRGEAGVGMLNEHTEVFDLAFTETVAHYACFLWHVTKYRWIGTVSHVSTVTKQLSVLRYVEDTMTPPNVLGAGRETSAHEECADRAESTAAASWGRRKYDTMTNDPVTQNDTDRATYYLAGYRRRVYHGTPECNTLGGVASPREVAADELARYGDLRPCRQCLGEPTDQSGADHSYHRALEAADPDVVGREGSA